MEATTDDTGVEAKVSPLKAMKLQDEQSLKTWLDQLGTSASIKVIVRRVAPKFFQGTKVSGELMTVEGTFDSDELREQHGGGTYTIAVHRMNKKGEYEHLQTRQLEIIGDPKLDGVFASATVNRPGQAVQQGGSDAVTQAALSMVRDVAKSATERADRAERSTGPDYALLEKMQAPLLAAAQDGPGRQARPRGEARSAHQQEARDHVPRRDAAKLPGRRAHPARGRARAARFRDPDDAGRAAPGHRAAARLV